MYKRENGSAVAFDEKSRAAPQRHRKSGYSIVIPIDVPFAPVTSVIRRTGWERRYRTTVVCCDLLALVVAHAFVMAGYLRGGIDSWRTPVVVAAALLTAIISLAAQRVWDERILGSGGEEYRRVIRGYFFAIAGLAVAGYGWGTSAGRSWAFGALPIALAFTLVGRKILQWRLSRSRSQGRCLRSVLVAGDLEEVHELVARADSLQQAGWRVDGICLTPDSSAAARPLAIDDVPVLGTEENVTTIAEQHRFEAVALLPSGRWSHPRMRNLSWELERLGADLLVAPVLMDVVGPRLHMAPVSGLPLLQMSAPCYSGPAWIVKNVLDRVLALLILMISAPVMLGVAVATKADGAGPVLHSQIRVGRGGRTYTVHKFSNDPDSSRVARFIRRHSLDGLPQLVNVVKGDMSLVGPRPPLESEVERYGDDGAARRLFVKPGLTGLWQVSRRDHLHWDESVRVDLRYVENWTLLMDLSILRRTAGAVLRGDSAY
ncbi:sugar transferase [Rhodococcus pyridinivorans]|uniref:sugar transferase n=1 Tax=Rhodococcus pyridinivorans TaxID=103816 RepID=UPI0020C6F40E|nr:sugar transferase [Rhodococcus pyridinivorans]UTM38257.1 sugar transferase [Rhodococcus pyridinivorans]